MAGHHASLRKEVNHRRGTEWASLPLAAPPRARTPRRPGAPGTRDSPSLVRSTGRVRRRPLTVTVPVTQAQCHKGPGSPWHRVSRAAAPGPGDPRAAGAGPGATVTRARPGRAGPRPDRAARLSAQLTARSDGTVPPGDP
eukprot:405464-Hanusia_phi.AAC.1